MSTAYACVMIAAILPLLFTGIAKFSGPGFNNRTPRHFQAQLTGMRARAHWAHLNSLEAFAPFAAAVLMAVQAGATQQRVDLLAMVFIACRIAYGACYLADLASLRSLMWAGGFACVIALFLAAGAT